MHDESCSDNLLHFSILFSILSTIKFISSSGGKGILIFLNDLIETPPLSPLLCFLNSDLKCEDKKT